MLIRCRSLQLSKLCMVCCISRCNGGNPAGAWDYWVSKGLVTGGNYNSQEGCQPYVIPECEHHVNGTRPPCSEGGDTPKCQKSCISGYPKTYQQDKHYGTDSIVISKIIYKLLIVYFICIFTYASF